MAYIQDFLDEENNKSATDTQLSRTSDNVTGGTAPTSSGPSASPAPKRATGSGFVNFDKYTSANREKALSMGQNLAQPVAQNIESERRARENIVGTAEKAIANNTVTDRGLISSIQSAPETFKDPALVNAFNKQTRGFVGPQSVESLPEYQDLSNIQSKNQADIGLLSSTEGIGTKLRQTVGPRYTAGENVLDTSLVSSGAAAAPIQDVRKQYQGLGNIQDLISGVNTKLGQAKATSEKTAADTRQAAQSKLGQLGQSLEGLKSSLAAETAAAGQKKQALQSSLQSGSADALKELGLTQKAYDTLKAGGFDLNSLVGDISSRKLGDIAGSTGQGYEALSSLLGQDSGLDLSKSGLQSPSIALNKDASAKAVQLGDILSRVEQDLAARQSGRQSDYQKAVAAADKSALAGMSSEDVIRNAELLGLSPNQYREALNRGLLTKDSIQQGAALDFGDLIGKSAPVYNQLITDLGLAKLPSSVDMKDEGKAFTVKNLEELLKLAKENTQNGGGLPLAKGISNESTLAKIMSGGGAISKTAKNADKIVGSTIKNPVSSLKKALGF